MELMNWKRWYRYLFGRVSIANWGLFNSRSILVDHGGNIEIESLEGQGTTVTVRLPLSSAARR